MVLIIGVGIFFLTIVVKIICIYKENKTNNEEKYGDCRIKQYYNDSNDIPLEQALKDFKLLNFN